MLPRIILLAELRDAERSWLEAALAAETLEAQAHAFSQVASRVGTSRWRPSQEHAEVLRQNDLDWLVRDASLDDIVRVVLFTHAVARSASPRAVAEAWYVHGSVEERRTVMRSLMLLPRPKQHLDLALLASLSPSRPVFEAICFDNPFAAQYFADDSFEHMVARARFLGAPMSRIIGYEARTRSRPEPDRTTPVPVHRAPPAGDAVFDD